MDRDLSRVVDKLVLADNGLPWYAQGMEGEIINCGGCHPITSHVRYYVARDHKIPNDDHFMWFVESHIKRFIYVDNQ